MLYTFTCPQCGKIVSTKIKSKKYCSPECKYKYNFKSHAVHEPRECPECHKVFITSTAARLYCSRECYYKSQWVTGGIFSTQENKEVEIARRVEKKYSRFEYIGGYDGADGHIYLRCRDCSSSFKTSVQNLKAGKGGKLNCPICSKVLKETEQKRETEERQRKAIQKRQEQKRIRFWGQDFEQQQFKSCAKCGGLMLGKNKYCSPKCAKAAQDERRGIARRLRVKIATIDNGITLEKVFFRDKGICYICGCKCNFDDYQIVNGAFISGKSYPTKEHVIPLSRGGKHSWDNVRLACFKCNTEKKDMTYEEFRANKEGYRITS